MRFASFLMARKNLGSDNIKLAYRIASSYHDYPSNLSSKASVFNFLNKRGFDPTIIDAFKICWNEFAELPYCTIKTKKRTNRKYVDWDES